MKASKYRLEELAWPDVQKYLTEKKSILLPVGSTEQHGPNGIIGVDFLTAKTIAEAVAVQTETLVAPVLPYGMALHHMAFPGTASLTPTTFIQVLKEICSSFVRHGFESIILINGHGGNIAPITSCFSEMLTSDQKTQFALYNWWHLPEVQAYEKIHFQDKNGFHATCGELSVTMHTHPEAYQTERNWNYFETPSEYPWPLSPSEFRKTFQDGRMGSDPRLANADHGSKIFQIAVDAISAKLK